MGSAVKAMALSGANFRRLRKILWWGLVACLLPAMVPAQQLRQSGIGVALITIEPSNLEAYDCSLWMEFENRQPEELRALAVEIILYGPAGDRLAAKLFETFDLRAGAHRREGIGIRLDDRYRGPGIMECPIESIEIVPRTCIGRGGDLFTMCRMGLFRSPRSIRPIRFRRDAAAVPLPDQNRMTARGHRARHGETAEMPAIGLSLANITSGMADQFALPEGSEGLVVIEDHRRGEASGRCVGEGDIIRELDQTPLRSVDDAAAAIATAESRAQRSVLVFGQSGADDLFCILRLQ